MKAVRLVPVGPVRCGTQHWRWRGQLYVTIVAKGTLAFDAPEAHWCAEQDELFEREQHWGGTPTRSLRHGSDLVPYLGGGEVFFEGAGYVAPGADTTVRLAVMRGTSVLIDKRIVVRAPAGEGALARVPIVYENALGGPGHAQNPVGRQRPLLLHPVDATIPVGFGPISRLWKTRASLLDAEQLGAIRQSVLELGDEFPWSYFHAAPADQRAASHFSGGERIVLDGLVPADGPSELTLPDARAYARVLPTHAHSELSLALDTIRIDGERSRVALTWRGFLPVVDDATVSVVAVGLGLRGATVAWPSRIPDTSEENHVSHRDVPLNMTADIQFHTAAPDSLPFDPTKARVVPPASDVREESASFGSTRQVEPDDPGGETLPFEPSGREPPVAFEYVAPPPPPPPRRRPAPEVPPREVVLAQGSGSQLLVAYFEARKKLIKAR